LNNKNNKTKKENLLLVNTESIGRANKKSALYFQVLIPLTKSG